MRVRVSFRVNTETGEVELFQVDDLGRSQQVEHDAVHEEIAHQIGSLIERRPDVFEVLPGSATPEPDIVPGVEEPEIVTRQAWESSE